MNEDDPLIMVGRGLVRRGATPAVVAPARTAEDDRLAEKLDDEIRDAD